MPYANQNWFRKVDGFHSGNYGDENAEAIIENPQSRLLTQEQLFETEGGYAGLLLNAGVVAAGLGAAFAYKPTMWRYLRMGQLRANEWFLIAGTAFLTYWLGQSLATNVLGDAEANHAHWMAYTYQKALNRYEGREVLLKAPRF